MSAQAPPAAVAPRTVDLPLGSAELAAVLLDGRYGPQAESLCARPLSVTEGAVRFELVPESALGRPAGLAVWLQAIRAISLTATATPCLATLLYGLAAGFPIRPLVAAAALLGALVLQISVNLWNDVEDYRRLIDLPGTFGGAGIIQKGWLSARTVQRMAVACLIIGGLLGLPALVLEPLPMLVIGAIALVGTAGYSGWPFGFKYKALGDLTVLVLCGPGLTLGFSYAAFGRIDTVVVALGAYFGAAAVAILHTNNLQDIAVDRGRGALTVAALLGESASKLYLLALYALTYAAWGFGFKLTQLSWVALLAPLLALPPIVSLCRKVLRATDLHAPALSLIRIQAAQVHLALGVTLCAGLAIALAIK